MSGVEGMVRMATSCRNNPFTNAYRRVATRRRRLALLLKVLIFISPSASRSGWGCFGEDGTRAVDWRCGAGLFF